jgi:DNA invertase Pin-like site-specific DNA recombinase
MVGLRPHPLSRSIAAWAPFRRSADGVDTKTPAGRFFFHVMASLAQMERELILERTRAGLGAARLQGRLGGR